MRRTLDARRAHGTNFADDRQDIGCEAQAIGGTGVP
jgi:hypothetical protein